MIAAITPENTLFSQANACSSVPSPLEYSLREACLPELNARLRAEGFEHSSDPQIQQSNQITLCSLEQKCDHVYTNGVWSHLSQVSHVNTRTSDHAGASIRPGDLLADESALEVFTFRVN